MKKLIICAVLMLLFPFSASAVTAPEIVPPSPPPTYFLGKWSLRIWDLASMVLETGKVTELDTFELTIDINTVEASGTRIILSGWAEEIGARVRVFYNPETGAANLQTTFYVFSLETGFGLLSLDSKMSVGTYNDTWMQGRATPDFYRKDRPAILYSGWITFFKTYSGGKG